MSTLVRSLALGVATGGRSMAGLAALALTRRTTGKPWVTPVALTAATVELIADKLPQTPSRLDPQPAAARVVVGALAGGLLSRREGIGGLKLAVGAALGAAGAAAGTRLGAAWRTVAAKRFDADLPGALLEDGATVLLALRSARTEVR